MMRQAKAIDGFKAGCEFERQRIRDIVELDEARGREGAALFLALRGDISKQLAKELLNAIAAGPVPTFSTRVLIPRHLRVAAETSVRTTS